MTLSAQLISYIIPTAALLVGVLLFAMTRRLVAWTSDDSDHTTRVLVLRIVIAGFIVLQVADLVLHHTMSAYYDRLLLRASLSVLAILGAIVLFNLVSRVFDARFGATRTLDGRKVQVPSYHSRMAGVVLLALLLVMLGYGLIEIWGMETLLEKTGFIGLVAAFLALTAPIWLPDIFHGLVLLGSSMADEGDTISVADQRWLYIINRLTPFYALLLDVDDNHRVLVRNSELIRDRVENLTNRASIDGLRRQIEFKLGYPRNGHDAGAVVALFHRVDQMVAASCARAQEDADIHCNPNVPFEWSLVEAGDNALRFVLYYHLAALPGTKLTGKIRAYLRGTQNRIVRMIFEEASILGLDLATPSLINIASPSPFFDRRAAGDVGEAGAAMITSSRPEPTAVAAP